MKNDLKLGVLGGMGTYATIIFMKLLYDLKNADIDQDNINMVVLNNSKIPDRTAYILDNSKECPLDYLKKDIKLLENSECTLIALTCNTAHHWYNELQSTTKLPIINMVELVKKEVLKRNIKKVGILATEGSIKTNVYNFNDIELFKPNEKYQQLIDSIIYDKVKKNKPVSKKEINEVIKYFKKNNCDCIIFGCTELSVVKYELDLKIDYIVDSLEELAKYIIRYDKRNI